MIELNPRAWSIDGECWCTRVDYDGYKKEWSGVVPVLAPDNRSKRIGEIKDTNIIVEFPTGLKDKNGKEICVGDIVQCGAYKGKVHYSVGAACYCVGDYTPIYQISRIENESFIALKVIGNIHENPELCGEEEE